MCEFSGKLTAWMDHELAAEDATDVTRHLETCAECRARVEAYSRVTTAFEEYCDAYCDAVMESRPRRKVRRRVLTVWEGAALAAAPVAGPFLLAAPPRLQLPANRPPAQAAGEPTPSPPPP